jgi:5'-3' exonuclease
MSKLLLIDGDEFLFRAAAAVEQEARFNEVLDEIDWNEPPVHVLYSHPGEAQKALDDMMGRIFERFNTKNHIMCFTTGPNFRYGVDPTYKNNRVGSRKPLCYALLREAVETSYTCKAFPTLEADDVMGVMATAPAYTKKHQCIIVSQDKDMKTIPTTVWNGKDLITYSEAEADYWHMYQTLVGDTSDGYKGCPAIGKVKAEKLLNAAMEKDEQTWPVVVAAYEKAGLTEADALTQARLARILRWSDWDNEKKQPILWTPHG